MGELLRFHLVLVRAQYVAAAPMRDTCCNTGFLVILGFGTEPELLAFGIIGSSKGFLVRASGHCDREQRQPDC